MSDQVAKLQQTEFSKSMFPVVKGAESSDKDLCDQFMQPSCFIKVAAQSWLLFTVQQLEWCGWNLQAWSKYTK